MRASGIASAGQQSRRFRKSVPSLRLRAGVPASTGLCKRWAKPESGPRETGRRRSSEGNNGSEGNSICPIRPACPFRRDFASAGRSPKAVPEQRVAAAARETAVHRKAGIQAAAPQAQRASSQTGSQTVSPTGSPTISQSRQRMLGLQVRSRSAQLSGLSRTAQPVAPPAKLSAIRRGLKFAALKVAHY